MRFLFSFIFSFLLFFSVFSQERTKISIETEYGEMFLELYNETPSHRDNFIKLVKEGFYDGTLFHRVIPGFMIQGGDPESKGANANALLGNGGPGYTIPAEFVEGLYHKKGALAAARMGDAVNPNKESSGSQFYIVQGSVFSNEDLLKLKTRMGVDFTEEAVKTYTTIGGTPHLDGSYTVFGQVIKGIEIIEKISGASRSSSDRPLKDMIMRITVID